MEFLELIKSLSEEELNDIVQERINYLEEFYCTELDNIGFQIDYNPSNYRLTDTSNLYDYGVVCVYRGYIPKNTKITYGVTNNTGNGLVHNEGCYYYLDDDSYILDFCKFIKKVNVLDEYDFFDYLLLFMENYFGYLENINRDDMFKMIYKENGLLHDPINEHRYSSFKKKGNALCSEYAVFAQNILSVFGFDMYMVFGAQGKTGTEDSSHAFNLITFKQEENSKIINLLADFCNSSLVIDINLEKVCRSPFIAKLDCIDEDFIDDLINNDKHLIFDDYNYMLFSNNIFKISNAKIRDYYINVTKQKDYVKKIGSGFNE